MRKPKAVTDKDTFKHYFGCAECKQPRQWGWDHLRKPETVIASLYCERCQTAQRHYYGYTQKATSDKFQLFRANPSRRSSLTY